MAIVKLKRARNSFLNVSKLPPEILGDIFRRNVVLRSDWGWLGENSHNFLLVCHHWFEVASCTPELWSFWGGSLQDWKKRHLRHQTVPLDLVFNGQRYMADEFDDRDLRDSLRDRVAQDTIRRIHLIAEYSEILESIISPLVGRKGIQSSSVESVIIRDMSEDTSIDVSDFFAHYLFPKLQRLELEGCMISSWDLMMSRTSVLTILTLYISDPSPLVTSLQILSIFRSNPSLQEISLYGYSIPDDGGSKSSQVPLPHLRELALAGHPQDIFTLLHQLDYPTTMDSLVLNIMYGTVEDASETVGPFLRDYLRHRGRSQSGLGLYVSTEDRVEFRVEDVGGTDFSDPKPYRMAGVVETNIRLVPMPPVKILKEVLLGLFTYVPREEILYFQTYNSPVSVEVISVQFPYLKAIRFEETFLDVAFPWSALYRDKILPHLQHVTLNQVAVRRGGWTPLITFLDHLASSGNKLDILEIDGDYDMDPEVNERVKGAVRELRVPNDDKV